MQTPIAKRVLKCQCFETSYKGTYKFYLFALSRPDDTQLAFRQFEALLRCLLSDELVAFAAPATSTATAFCALYSAA